MDSITLTVKLDTTQALAQIEDLTARLDALAARYAKLDATALGVPTFTYEGVKYREEKEVTCEGCAFENRSCDNPSRVAIGAFGDDCSKRRVIYVRAE